MASKSKFSGLTELREQHRRAPEGALQSAPDSPKRAGQGAGLDLPVRRPTGKRSNPDWKQKAVLLKIASCEAAEARLRKNHEGTDFSDLMQALLDQWLDAPS